MSEFDANPRLTVRWMKTSVLLGEPVNPFAVVAAMTLTFSFRMTQIVNVRLVVGS